MYDLRHTVFCFLVVYIINIAAKNAGDDLNLARIFHTPKDFSRVNFDHFEILERNNFDTPAESQQEQVAADADPATLLQPKSVANAQVMLRFGGDDIQGKNCIENGNKDRPCPNHNQQYPTNNEIRYLPYSPCYCHPAHQSLPYLPSPLPPYGYPYPPYAFPGPYYPRPEFGRGPYGPYHDHLIPREDSCSCSQERRAFLGQNDVPGNIRTENIPVTIDLTEDVIPKCQKCLENPRNPATEENPLHQNQPNEESNHSENRSLKFLHFIKNFGKSSSPEEEKTPQAQQDLPSEDKNPKGTIPVEEPKFVTKEDVTEPEVSISIPDGHQNSTEGKLSESPVSIIEANIIKPEHSTGKNSLQQNYPSESYDPNGTTPAKYPDFVTEDKDTRPRHPSQNHPQHENNPSGGYNPNQSRPDRFPDFITKEDVIDPKYPTVNYQKYPCGCNPYAPRPERFPNFDKENGMGTRYSTVNYPSYPSGGYNPNQSRPGKFPDFITKENLVEPKYHTAEYPYNPSGRYNPNQSRPGRFPGFHNEEDVMKPQYPTVHYPNAPSAGYNANAPRPGNFPDFIRKEDLLETKYPTENYPNPTSGKNKPNKPRPGRFPDFITKEDVMEPEYPTANYPYNPSGGYNPNQSRPERFPDSHNKEDVMKSQYPTVHYPNAPSAGYNPNASRPGKFPDFIKKEDLLETKYPTENYPNPTSGENNPNKPRPVRFPDFITKEDVMEPEYPTANYPIHISSGFNPDQHRPGRFPNLNNKGDYSNHSNHPSAGYYPDSTTKDGGFKWPGSNKCPHPNHPCGGRPEKLPEPITPEDVEELEHPVGECSHHHEHPCKGYRTDEPRPWKFSDFVIKDNTTRKTWPIGDCHLHNHHCGGDDPTTIKPEVTHPEYPEGECSHHHKHPCKGYKPDDTRPWKFADFVIGDNAMEPTRPVENCHHHNHHCGDHEPTTTKPEVIVPEYPVGQYSHHHSKDHTSDESRPITFPDSEHPTGKNHGKSPDFITKEDLIEPKYLTGKNPDYQTQPIGGMNPDKTRPDNFSDFMRQVDVREIDHQNGMNREKNPSEKSGKFPEFITKEDVQEPEYPTVDYPNQQNITKYGQLSDPLNKEDMEELKHTTDNSKWNSNVTKPGKFPGFITKEDVEELPIVIKEISTEPPVAEVCSTTEKEEEPVGENECENHIPPVMRELNRTSAADMAEPIFFFPVDPAQPILVPAIHKPTISKNYIKPVVICVKHPASSPFEYNNVDVLKKPELENWLNKSLIPYNCQICGHKHKLLVTYPLTSDITHQQCIEDINDTGCQCFRNKGFCDCCNCHRNPNIPFGMRFPSDLDSLQRIVAPVYQSAGYSTTSGSSMSTSVSQVGNRRPKVYIDGYHTSEGSGYYSDPSRNVYYQQPKVLDVVRTSSPYLPVVEHTRVEQPEWYSVVPKYDIVPKKITSLDVPDLLPTDVFICKQCNNPHDRRIVCHREYVPREACPDQRGPSRAVGVGEVVEGEPLVRYSPPQKYCFRRPAIAA